MKGRKVPATILPYVRMIIPCEKIEYVNGRVLLTEPLTVVDVVDERVDLMVFVSLAGGLGDVEIQIEVRYSPTDADFQSVRRSDPVFLRCSATADVVFTRDNRGITPFAIPFTVTKIPMRKPGLYEFRAVSKGQILTGQTAELRVIQEAD
jgi:hypothetical protein